MRIVVTREELAACLPRAGRYRVCIRAVTPIPAERPVEIELLLAVVAPPPLPTLIHDRFPIRGAPLPLRPLGYGGQAESLTGMHRLLELLHLAGVRVMADTPLDLGALLGLELLADVRREPGASGFPYARVVAYSKPWKPGPCAAGATRPRSCAHGRRGIASAQRPSDGRPDPCGRA